MSIKASHDDPWSDLQRYRALVERLPAIVYIASYQEEETGPGPLLYVSPQIEEILGFSPEEWLESPETSGRPFHPDDRNPLGAEYERIVAPGESFTAEYRLIARDGRTVWFRDDASLARKENGEPLFWQGVMVDVTQEHRAVELERDLLVERETAQRLREIDDMKNTFLRAVSHDLRTPLAAILGLAVTLERADVEIDREETREMATRIATNARKLDRLVNDILDLDRLTHGVVEPVREPVDIGELVERIAREFDFDPATQLEVEAQHSVVPVDAAKVERVVENLFSNAVKHAPGAEHVWVRVSARDGGALIEVADDGPGVPEEMWDEIFEPFRRGPAPPTHAPGMGIGLSLVARFAELHGGRAWIEQREGGGPSFRVFLPGSAANRRAPEPGAPPP